MSSYSKNILILFFPNIVVSMNKKDLQNQNQINDYQYNPYQYNPYQQQVNEYRKYLP